MAAAKRQIREISSKGFFAVASFSVMHFAKDFVTDFDVIVDRWRACEPFAFVRFGDGEAAILRGRKRPFRTMRASEKWQSDQLQGAFRTALRESLCARLEGYAVGVLCPHCSDVSSQYLWEQVGDDRDHCTFAEIFGNANWPRVPWIDLIEETNTFVVGSSKKCDLRIPIDLPNNMKLIDEVVAQLLELDRPIAVCAGPAANVIVHRYWQRVAPERRQVCIDLGSTLDPWLHIDKTRGHHVQGSWDQTLHCTFDPAKVRERGFVHPILRQ